MTANYSYNRKKLAVLSIIGSYTSIEIYQYNLLKLFLKYD